MTNKYNIRRTEQLNKTIMSNKKPNVFPTQEQINQANETGEQINNQFQGENNITNQNLSEAEAKASAEMKRRTEEQLRLRNEQLNKNQEISNQIEKTREEKMKEKQIHGGGNNTPPIYPTNNNYGGGNDGFQNNNTQTIEYISQPQMNQPFDVLPLPSEGKLYPGRKSTVKVAYLTTADENILTSPNLVESGDFLEILINRKLLEPNIRYKDLLPGDRNAIMIWLRATGYGEMYPVQIYDESTDEPFETEIDLSKLKTIKLNIEPDSDGLFSFILPLSKANVRFKLLTVGDIDRLEKIVLANKDNLINQEQTLILQNQLIEVNGNRDRNFINNFVNNMRIMDTQKLREYMLSIDCGVDMNITVRTPGGGSINTFLPLTTKFFWPNANI